MSSPEVKLTLVVQGNAVVVALLELFRSFAAEESKVWDSGQRQVVSPAALRKALHSWSQAKFHLGTQSPPPDLTWHSRKIIL
jgi:hypothetical protein